MGFVKDTKRVQVVPMPKPRATKKPGGQMKAINVRMPETLLAEVDALMPRIQAERLDMNVTQADAVRILIAEAVATRKARAK